MITTAVQRCKPTFVGSMSPAIIRSASAALRLRCSIFDFALAINDEADGRASFTLLDTSAACAGTDRQTVTIPMMVAMLVGKGFISMLRRGGPSSPRAASRHPVAGASNRSMEDNTEVALNDCEQRHRARLDADAQRNRGLRRTLARYFFARIHKLRWPRRSPSPAARVLSCDRTA